MGEQFKAKKKKKRQGLEKTQTNFDGKHNWELISNETAMEPEKV